MELLYVVSVDDGFLSLSNCQSEKVDNPISCEEKINKQMGEKRKKAAKRGRNDG